MRWPLKPHCFVISDIGEPASERRKRADQFFGVIQRALDLVAEQGLQTGSDWRFSAHRLDSDTSVDETYFPRIVDNILESRLIVAVISNNSKNVPFELGLAMAAGRPVTMLVERTGPTAADIPSLGNLLASQRPQFDDVPSDLRGFPVVECDLSCCMADDRTKTDEQAAQALAVVMITQLKAGEPAAALKKYRAFGKGAGVDYLNRANELSFAAWSRMLWDSEHQISIATTSLHYLCEPNTKAFFSRKRLVQLDRKQSTSEEGDLYLLTLLAQRAVFEGVNVRLFLLSPHNPFVDQLVFSPRLNEHSRMVNATKYLIARNLRIVHEFFNPIAADLDARIMSQLEIEYPSYDFQTLRQGGSVEIVEVKRGPLYSRITMTEREAFLTPYHSSEPYNTGPAFYMRRDNILTSKGIEKNGLYEKALRHLDDLYLANTGSITRITGFDLAKALAVA